jgi:thioredoxin-related protein
MKKNFIIFGAIAIGLATMSFLLSTKEASSQTKPETTKPNTVSTEAEEIVEEGGINWMTIEEAMAAESKQPRKIMIDVYTKWCGPCKMMSQNTFTDADVVAYMNEHYYCVKFDAERADSCVFKGQTFKNPDFDPAKTGRNGVHQFARYLNVSAYPTLVFLDETGGLIGPVVGYKTPGDLELFVKFFVSDQYKQITTPEQWQAYMNAFKPTWKK